MTIRFILEGLLQVCIPTILALLFLKHRTQINYLRIIIFSAVYILYQLILVLPAYGKPFSFIESRWNWDGKIYAIIFGIFCYFVFKKYLVTNNFFTFKQEPKSNRITWIVTFSVILVMSLIYYFIATSDFNVQTLAFQLLMPALDEEMIFRGIFLGLLLTALPGKVLFLGNPAVFVTGILFGLMHALTLSKDYNIEFETLSFFHTGLGGWVFGWLAYKSRSILKPILCHGGTNFLAALATMIK